MNFIEQKKEMIITLNDYLDKLIPGIEDMVNAFYEGNDKYACDKLSLITDGLQWCMRVIEATKDITKLTDETEQLAEHFNTIVEGLENEDFILVADIFNYEVNDILKSIKENLVGIIAA